MLASIRTEGRDCSSGMLAICLWGSCPPGQSKAGLCVYAQGLASLARVEDSATQSTKLEEMPVSQLEWRAGKTQNKGGKEEGGAQRMLQVLFQSWGEGGNPRKLPTIP